MKKILVIAVLATLTVSAQAKMGFMKKFKAQYPNTTLSDCVICHNASGDYTLNAYGEDLQKNSINFKAVEALDSDGDGATNLAEIAASTFPGDKSSVPQL